MWPKLNQDYHVSSLLNQDYRVASTKPGLPWPYTEPGLSCGLY
jgi:hypothetical protein